MKLELAVSDTDLLDKYGLTVRSNAPVKAQTQGDELLSKYGLTDTDQPYKGSNLGPLQGNQPTTNNLDDWWKNWNSNDLAGTLARLGIGAVRGAKDVLDTGAHGLGNVAEFIADKTLPENLAAKVRNSVEGAKLSDLVARQDFDKNYPFSDTLIPNASDVGRFGGQVAATLPIMPARAFEGISTLMNAAPTVLSTGGKVAAPILNRIAAAGAQGAAGGSIFNAATSSANDKSLAENVGEGAISGAVGGPIITGAAGLGSKLASKVAGTISPERANLARRASQFGIDLDAGQVSESPFWKKFNQVSGWLPGSGAGKASSKQLGQFSKAISNTFGENTPNLTPQLLNSAKKRIGNDYETVARNTTINADQQLAHNLAQVYDEARTTLGKDQFERFDKIMQNQIFHKFQNGKGTLSGEGWQATRHINSPFSRAMNGSDTDLGKYLKDAKGAMDAAFNRSAPQDMQGLLQQANRQYKAMKTVKDIADKDPEGLVNPLLLMQKVNKAPGGRLGAGDLNDLAEIGRAFFKQPSDSGTPLGELILDKVAHGAMAPLAVAGAGANALAQGSFIAPSLEAAVGLAANRGLRSAINSAPVRERLINAANGADYGLLDAAANKVVPYASNLPVATKRPRVVIDTGDIDKKRLKDMTAQ